MDEQQAFELFHDALDVQPRLGAFDRLRAVLAARSAAPGPNVAINMPLPRISRSVVAAALVVALIVAAVGGFLVVNHALRQGIPAGSRGTIVIGSDDRTSGGEAQVGLPIQLGEAFAVARVGSVRGYSLKLVTYDDTWNGVGDPQKGAQNVRAMLADRRLLGIVGPSRANVAAAMIPVANRASVAVISPVNTWTCLTVDLPCGGGPTPSSLRPTGANNYFRIAALNVLSGPAMADFAFGVLGLRAVAVWSDSLEGGVSDADGFSTEFAKRGGTVVSRQAFDLHKGAPDFRPWLRQAKAAGAEAVYAAAQGGSGGCLARAQSQGIFDTTSYYLGGGSEHSVGEDDGIVDDECIHDAGQMANDHMYATLGIGAAELNPGAQPVIAAYRAAHPDPASLSTGTFAGYDCAMIMIEAIGRAIDANGGRLPTRAQVLRQVAQTKNFAGLTGTFTFDTAGDPIAPTVQVVQNRGGVWTPVTNLVINNPMAG